MNLNVNIQAEQFLARLHGMSTKLSQNMLRVVTRLSVEVQAAVKDKLSGGVLHVRSGTLRRSINRVVTQEGGSTTAVVGTNVIYAGVHEFGFDGVVTVRAHTRHINAPSKIALHKIRGHDIGIYETKPGKPTGGVANVREYSRHMVMPERSYLRSTLADFTVRIQTDIRAAALEAVL